MRRNHPRSPAGPKLNALTGAIVWVLVLLSIILTASVLFPTISGAQIVTILLVGLAVGIGIALYLLVQARRNRNRVTVDDVLAETVHRDTGACLPCLASTGP